MKYRVYVYREYYVSIDVEADTPEQAAKLADKEHPHQDDREKPFGVLTDAEVGHG